MSAWIGHFKVTDPPYENEASSIVFGAVYTAVKKWYGSVKMRYGILPYKFMGTVPHFNRSAPFFACSVNGPFILVFNSHVNKLRRNPLGARVKPGQKSHNSLLFSFRTECRQTALVFF